MQQLSFEMVFKEFIQETIHLEEDVKNELLIHMASAITDVFQPERKKSDDNLPEQP